MMKRKELVKRKTEYLRLRFAAQSMAAFVLYTFPGYEMDWVHEEICAKLDAFLKAVLEKKGPRLMLMMPPRHGKSELASRRFPAFALGVNPSLSVIAASYAAPLANMMCRDVERIMGSPLYARVFPMTRLPDRRAKRKKHLRVTGNFFELEDEKGSYRAAGVGGSITGMGADILIIDDPVKDGFEAGSIKHRNRIHDWYSSVALTRLEPGGGIILIMTRWHDDDLCGRLLAAEKTGGTKWDVVRYPAIAECDEPKRKKGEALCPSRYGLEYLLRTKDAVGSRTWSSLYQQRPEEEGGNIVKREWFRHYDVLPKNPGTMVMSLDLPFNEPAWDEFVTIQVWKMSGGVCYLIDQLRERMNFPEMLKALGALVKKYPAARTRLLDREKTAGVIADTIKGWVCPVLRTDSLGGSVKRFHAAAAYFAEGKVYLPNPETAPWAEDYEAALLKFPAGKYRDEADATSLALCYLLTRRGLKFNPKNLLLLR